MYPINVHLALRKYSKLTICHAVKKLDLPFGVHMEVDVACEFGIAVLRINTNNARLDSKGEWHVNVFAVETEDARPLPESYETHLIEALINDGWVYESP